MAARVQRMLHQGFFLNSCLLIQMREINQFIVPTNYFSEYIPIEDWILRSSFANTSATAVGSLPSIPLGKEVLKTFK